MNEIKDKVASVSGGVEITRSSNMFIEGELSQWKEQIYGTNGVIINVPAGPVRKSSALIESTLNVKSSMTNEGPVALQLMRVESFAQNPSGYGNVISIERARAKKKVALAHSKAA